MTHQGESGIGACGQIDIVFVERQLCQFPLISVIVVVVDPVINGAPDVRKGGTAGNLMGKLIFHKAEEALLGRIVSAVVPARHGLPQSMVFQEVDKLHAGIVAAPVAVEDGPAVEGDPVGAHQFSYCFQYKVYFEGLADDIVQGLFRAGIQNCREVTV